MTKLTVTFHSFAKPLRNAKGSFECIDSAVADSQQEISHSCLVAGCYNTVLWKSGTLASVTKSIAPGHICHGQRLAQRTVWCRSSINMRVNIRAPFYGNFSTSWVSCYHGRPPTTKTVKSRCLPWRRYSLTLS